MPPRRKPAASASLTAEAGKPVYAIVGNEPFLQGMALASVIKSQPDDAQRVDIEGPTADASDVFEELRSFAMFGGNRVVVVRDADDFISAHRDSLERYLESPSSPNVLVLRATTMPSNTRVYKSISKIGQVLKCESPSAGQIPKWLQNRARSAHGFTLTPEAADLLASLIGTDLGSLDAELAKLALQADDKPVGPELFADHVAFRREQQMWTLTDALSRGEPGEALQTWRELQQTDTAAAFKATVWLAIWLDKSVRGLAMLEDGDRPPAIAKALRIYPFNNVDPLLSTARRLGTAGLRHATRRIAELDLRSKTGLGDQARAVDQFIAEVATRLADSKVRATR